MARRLGVSERHAYRLLAKEREGGFRADEGRCSDRDPYVSIVQGELPDRGEWYDLATDRCSVEHGFVRVPGRNGFVADGAGGSNRSPVPALEGQRLTSRDVNGGPRVSDKGRKDHKPDPKGLAGGVGKSKQRKKNKPAAKVGSA